MLAHTLVSHITDPLGVLREAHRVVKPGGVVAIFDGDYASLTVSHSDPDLAMRVEETLLELIINNPRVMRDMPCLLRDAGLELSEVTPDIYAEIGGGSFFANIPESYATILKGSGLLPEDDVERWRTELAQAVDEGPSSERRTTTPTRHDAARHQRRHDCRRCCASVASRRMKERALSTW